MFLHLGQETVVKTDEIIGIFDMDTSTVQKSTRDYLSRAEKKGEVITITYELPKTFVVVNPKKKRERKVYISQLSSSTLHKRNNFQYSLLKNSKNHRNGEQL